MFNASLPVCLCFQIQSLKLKPTVIWIWWKKITFFQLSLDQHHLYFIDTKPLTLSTMTRYWGLIFFHFSFVTYYIKAFLSAIVRGTHISHLQFWINALITYFSINSTRLADCGLCYIKQFRFTFFQLVPEGIRICYQKTTHFIQQTPPDFNSLRFTHNSSCKLR